MGNLSERLERLESAAGGKGPLLLSWVLDGANLAMAEHGGERYTQRPAEDRSAFLRRVAEVVPRRSVVWVSELDAKL